MFRGSAAAKIDQKGRLKVPTELRRQLEERYGPEVFVTSVDGKSALLYPLTVWESVEARLQAMPSTERVKRKYLERVNYYGQQLQLDGQGRLLMPQVLRERAQMVGEVVLSGRLDHLELWNHERFEAHLDEEPFTDDDFEALARFGV